MYQAVPSFTLQQMCQLWVVEEAIPSDFSKQQEILQSQSHIFLIWSGNISLDGNTISGVFRRKLTMIKVELTFWEGKYGV